MPRRQGGVESMETTRNLPDDILEEEILVRVPVKFLVRWKCVCKHWYALFGDYDFTMKHYRFQYAHHGTLPLFLDRPISYPGPGRDQTEFFVLSKHGADDVVLNVTPDFHRDIPPPFANEYQLKLTSRCMGIVNGVIGLQWGNTCLALWNPATGEFKDVPCWPVMPDNKVAEEFCGRILGLGFDVQSHDFKILGLIDFDGAGVEPTVYEYHLYSLKANSWKKVKDPDCHNREHKRYADGRGCRDCSFSLTLGKYKETLALFVSNSMKNSEDGYVEIWAVTRFREDDHGVPLSWHLAVRVSHTPSCIGLYVLKFRECGDLLLMIQYGRFGEEVEGCLYDPSTRTFNNLGVTCCSSFTYVESLFSVTTTIKDA